MRRNALDVNHPSIPIKEFLHVPLQLTAAEAALRAGRQSLARALVAERLALKPQSAFNLQLLERAQMLEVEAAP